MTVGAILTEAERSAWTPVVAREVERSSAIAARVFADAGLGEHLRHESEYEHGVGAHQTTSASEEQPRCRPSKFADLALGREAARAYRDLVG